MLQLVADCVRRNDQMVIMDAAFGGTTMTVVITRLSRSGRTAPTGLDGANPRIHAFFRRLRRRPIAAVASMLRKVSASPDALPDLD